MRWLNNWKSRMALLLVLSGVQACGHGQNASANDAANCQEFRKELISDDFFKATKLLPRKIESNVSHCKVDDLDIGSILVTFYKFHQAMMERDHPNLMARTGDVNSKAIYKKDIKIIDTALANLKGSNRELVQTALEFMAKQYENRYTYAWSALEIAARDYPDTYNEYESLTAPNTEGRRAWNVTKQRWIEHNQQ